MRVRLALYPLPAALVGRISGLTRSFGLDLVETLECLRRIESHGLADRAAWDEAVREVWTSTQG